MYVLCNKERSRAIMRKKEDKRIGSPAPATLTPEERYTSKYTSLCVWMRSFQHTGNE